MCNGNGRGVERFCDVGEQGWKPLASVVTCWAERWDLEVGLGLDLLWTAGHGQIAAAYLIPQKLVLSTISARCLISMFRDKIPKEGLVFSELGQAQVS